MTKFLIERKLFTIHELNEEQIPSEIRPNLQIIGCVIVLMATRKIWVHVWMTPLNEDHTGFLKLNAPITANPSKVAEANRVGGCLASPIN